jgi:periplasmic protein TonB
MPFQALLFCPDDKTARTLTQVLGELEFTVEPCAEPFSAVKKLMSQHFDALVVDCDNEQNATLLFKSARNSTSNQASLAVAIVEGQAGVAKAFRIGANLVLTKPINVEQSKGTLRVARGLLRKGDPGKPAAASAAPASSAATTAPAAAKPAATKPVPAKTVPPRPGARVAPASVTRPVAPPIAPAPKSSADVAAAMAAESSGLAPENEIPEVKAQAPSVAASHIAPSAAPHSGASAKPSFDLKSQAPATSFGSAAAAPAPARETHPVDAPKPEAPAEKPLEAHAVESSPSPSAPAAAPSFTFGGANEPEESSGGSKKILLGVAAVVVVAAGLYAGWNFIAGHSSQSASQTAASVPAPQPVKPSTPPAKPAATTPEPTSQPAADASTSTANSTAATASDDHASASDASAPVDITLTTKPSASTSPKPSSSSPTKKPAVADPESEPESAPAPLVVKGGVAPHSKPAATDTPAPSVIGIGTPNSTQGLPNLGTGDTSAPKPVLEKLTVSQGVSQGLLVKKIPPVYPKTALAMHVEGTVELTATVSKSGDITSVKLLKGEPTLARAAMDAVKEWKYKPYLLNGEPVEIQTQVTVSFKLPN